MKYPIDDPRHPRYKEREKYRAEANMPLKKIDRDVEVLTASALLERLDTIEANVTNTKHNFVGHTRSILDRLGIIESQIESMGNAQRRMWDLLDDTAELTALLSEAQDGID